MMTSIETYNVCKGIKGWEITANFSVGGFEWLGFSKVSPEKMIVISEQRTTLVDCNDGSVEDCEIVFDEQDLTAFCDRLPDEELDIVGQYGGELPQISGKGEKVFISTNDKHIMQIVFVGDDLSETLIYHSYDAYLCGFGHDGNYFVLADDGGILIMKRK
ncbi:MAG: hypothetical protein IJ736_03680 [Firmicutes bacterium]|nr:hypothetical protein [Bacillota bacterium]